jgi:hypothetical protein
MSHTPFIGTEDRLFIGTFPTGIVYADRRREEHGDYQRVAFLSYRSLKLEINSKAHKQLAKQAAEHAATIQARRGEQFQVSTCGQTITLGA